MKNFELQGHEYIELNKLLKLLHLVGAIAAIVYLVDVRPAVQELSRR